MPLGTRLRRGGLRGELLLAVPPTLAVIGATFLIATLQHQRILVTSLASSAFLIYRDPRHRMNAVRRMVPAQIIAALLGAFSSALLTPGYAAGGVAMGATILVLVFFEIMHPPAVSTALAFAFTSRQTRTIAFFLPAVLLLVVLVILQRTALAVIRAIETRELGSDR